MRMAYELPQRSKIADPGVRYRLLDLGYNDISDIPLTHGTVRPKRTLQRAGILVAFRNPDALLLNLRGAAAQALVATCFPTRLERCWDSFPCLKLSGIVRLPSLSLSEEK